MKTINAKVLTFKYWLAKKLSKSLENDKNAIKNGAKITFNDYCKIQIVECTKTSFDKDKIEMLAKRCKIDISSLKSTTNYLRIDIDNIPTEVDDKVNQVLDTIEDENDRVITKAASSVARR